MEQQAKGGKVKLQKARSGGYEVKFDPKDYTGWAGSFFTWWRGIKKPHWVNPGPPGKIADDFRIAILGDWGTGLYGAPMCAESIARTSPGYNMVLHLGDVYYSGTPREVQERFLKAWPRVPRALSRALNSNHEMYTGGHGYFDQTLTRFRQSGSTFAIQNAHWLLVGLDTAYEEHDLARDQAPWLRRLVAKARKEGRRVVLFSHHQPYSIFEKGGEKLLEKLKSLLENREIFAWYWGHEHRCVIYESHPNWGLAGRCVGHGGFPYFRDQLPGASIASRNADGSTWRKLQGRGTAPAALVLDGPNPYIVGQENNYGPHGYMTLRISGPRLSEIVHSPGGAVIYNQQLC